MAGTMRAIFLRAPEEHERGIRAPSPVYVMAA
jgi:hypothetical protein